jgi:drug/metabolite transporter (DMT)-like permease
MTRQHRRLAWMTLFIVYVVWGSTYLAIRVVVRTMPPFAAAGLRFAVAGSAMAVVAWLTERPRSLPTWRQWRDYGLVGVLLLVGANGLVMWAEKSVPSGITALVVATVPVWLTLLDGLRPGGQPWSARGWLGTLVGLAGVALVVRPEAGAESVRWPGILALQCAALSWSLGSLYAKAITTRLSVLTASAIEMLAGAFGLLLLSRIAGESWLQLHQAPASAWIGLTYLVVFGSLVGFTAFAHALAELPASVVGTYAYVNPVVAVVLGAVLLDETVSTHLVFGAGLILAGVLLATLAPRRPREQPSGRQ